jgi:hypothetical protein
VSWEKAVVRYAKRWPAELQKNNVAREANVGLFVGVTLCPKQVGRRSEMQPQPFRSNTGKPVAHIAISPVLPRRNVSTGKHQNTRHPGKIQPIQTVARSVLGVKMKKSAHGILFAVPLPDETYVFGRVVLDVYACLKQRMLPADSPLPGLGKALLVEMYSAVSHTPTYTPSAKLIRGAFVDSDELGESWQVISRLPVNPREVEFPETIIGCMHPLGDGRFECGEIKVLLPIGDNVSQRVGEFSTRHSAFLWHYTCLRAMGRNNEVPKGYEGATLAGCDLRNSPHRALIYQHLPFPMEMSYYEKQKIMGFDLDRLYCT